MRKLLVGAGWVQRLKNKTKNLSIIGARNATDSKKLGGPFLWQSRLSRFHQIFYILVCFSSFLRQRRHLLLEVGLKSSFFDTFSYISARCIQKDLCSSFWWDEFEVEFWQACVYLKTSAKHLQCLLSLSALLVALRLFNVLVSFPQDPVRRPHQACRAIPNKIANKRQQRYYFFWFAIHFTTRSLVAVELPGLLWQT